MAWPSESEQHYRQENIKSAKRRGVMNLIRLSELFHFLGNVGMDEDAVDTFNHEVIARRLERVAKLLRGEYKPD